MISLRATIKSIEDARRQIEELGSELKSNYAFKDIIFVKKHGDFDLNTDFVRLRIYTKNNWDVKKFLLTRKQTKWVNGCKQEKLIIKKEFDTEIDAKDFISINLKEFEKGFEYEREGWQYIVKNCNIFLEDIDGFGPSVEIESIQRKDLDDLIDKIKIKEILKDSIPEVMRKRLA